MCYSINITDDNADNIWTRFISRGVHAGEAQADRLA
jgi:hypothetical protein